MEKRSIVPGLGLSLLVSLCLWTVNCTNVPQFFSLPRRDRMARVDWSRALPPGQLGFDDGAPEVRL